MAINLQASLRKEIDRIKKELSRKGSELVSLREQLRTHERAYRLLAGPAKRTESATKRLRKRPLVNWNAVLKALPSPFTTSDLPKRPEAKGKSSVYLRQVVSRWAKQRKTKRVVRGKYRKV